MTQLIVFDMAGTTVDEDNVVYKTVHKALERAGFSFTFEEVLESAAGKEKKHALSDLMAKHQVTDEEKINACFEDFKNLLKHAYQDLQVKSMPKAEETFKQLREKGIKVALNTGYDQTTVDTLLTKLGWTEGSTVDAIVNASMVSKARPEPDMILKSMELTGIADSSAVMKVGDSIIDIEEGKNASCGKSIGITTGAHTREQLETASPDAVISSLEELHALL